MTIIDALARVCRNMGTYNLNPHQVCILMAIAAGLDTAEDAEKFCEFPVKLSLNKLVTAGIVRRETKAAALGSYEQLSLSALGKRILRDILERK